MRSPFVERDRGEILQGRERSLNFGIGRLDELFNVEANASSLDATGVRLSEACPVLPGLCADCSKQGVVELLFGPLQILSLKEIVAQTFQLGSVNIRIPGPLTKELW